MNVNEDDSSTKPEIVGAVIRWRRQYTRWKYSKPAARGSELQLVEKHTHEYRIIEKDAALERRMQPVKVDEPTVEETITILKGIQENTKTTTTFIMTGLSAAAILSKPLHPRSLPARQGH